MGENSALHQTGGKGGKGGGILGIYMYIGTQTYLERREGENGEWLSPVQGIAVTPPVAVRTIEAYLLVCVT